MANPKYGNFERVVNKLKTAYLKKAMQYVVTDIIEGIKQNKQVSGEGPFPALEKSTIKRKGHAQPLIHKGLLTQDYTYQKLMQSRLNRGVISIKDRSKGGDTPRDKVGVYLQIEGIRSKRGKKFFRFFGVSKDAEAKMGLLYDELVTKGLEAI